MEQASVLNSYSLSLRFFQNQLPVDVQCLLILCRQQPTKKSCKVHSQKGEEFICEHCRFLGIRERGHDKSMHCLHHFKSCNPLFKLIARISGQVEFARVSERLRFQNKTLGELCLTDAVEGYAKSKFSAGLFAH